MKNLYTRDQWLVVISACLFLVGAGFMLAYVFGAQAWAFWAGLGTVLVASVAIILGGLDSRRRTQQGLQSTVVEGDKAE